MAKAIPYRVVGRNIDTLLVNAFGEFIDGIPAFLDTMQTEAQAARDSDKYHGEVLIETGWHLADMPLLIRPHGGGKGQWQWILICPGATFELGTGRLNDIVCRTRLGSAFLWEHGYRHAWQLVETFLAELGNFRYQPSEVHLCADIAGLPFTALKDKAFITRGHVVRWAQEDALILDLEPSHHYQEKRAMVEVAVRYREPETITFSRTAPQSAIVYNKPREIRLHSRDKLWFADIWKANGWDGESRWSASSSAVNEKCCMRWAWNRLLASTPEWMACGSTGHNSGCGIPCPSGTSGARSGRPLPGGR